MRCPTLAALAALLMTAFVLSAGCGTSVVPPELEAQVDKGLSLSTVQLNPGQYQGKTVLWGGRILKVINKSRGSLLEVLQFPLDSDDRPDDSSASQGRFVVSMSGFFDPAVYSQDRAVTVVARVTGAVEAPVGQYAYTFIYLRGDMVKLWPQTYDQPMPDATFGIGVDFGPAYPPPYWGGPYYPWW